MGIDEDSPFQSPQYEKLLEVVTRTVTKLNIDLPAEKKAESQKRKLDEAFLWIKPPPLRWSLPYFPDLPTEVCRKAIMEKAILGHSIIYIPASDYYGNVTGMIESGYKTLPRVEQTICLPVRHHL